MTRTARPPVRPALVPGAGAWEDADIATTLIRLLGPPALEDSGGGRAPPRGRKAWAVLAYVLLSPRSPTREHVAGLLFATAADPLGALRWTLAELRRCLGAPGALRGDPIRTDLPEWIDVDVALLGETSPAPELARGPLLEGLEGTSDEAFASWLLVERRRVAGLCEGVLRDAALAELGGHRPHAAAALAHRAVALSPYDESLMELLVRCMRATGDVAGARAQAAAWGRTARHELGREPDPRIARAAEEGSDGPQAVGDRVAALAQLAAGRATLEAGAIEPGIACLRHAAAEAGALGDPGVSAVTLAALGSALVHAVRGRDEEGAALLHEALALAERAGDDAVALEACRELGYVEVQAGRGAAAGRWLARATDMARDDTARAGVLGIRGMSLSDRAHYGPAARLLEASIACAERSGERRWAAWSLALLGRLRLLRGELEEAATALDRSLGLIHEGGWVALRPLPQSLRGEVTLLQGDPERALDELGRAFSLGCRLGDPCWEAFAARARGLALEAVGDADAAVTCLVDASERAIRVADPYAWIRAHCIDALVGALLRRPQADLPIDASIDEMEAIAARGDMRELLVRAAVHRSRRGTPSALPSALLLAEAIDNPVLTREVAAAA